MKLCRLPQCSLLACVLALMSCAGGGETGTGFTNDGSDISVGTITKFGSIWVNGVEFNTSATQVKLEDAVASTSALRLGMVVMVKGKINPDGISGTANEVQVREVIKGPISAKSANTLTVLGQAVLINDQTLFENSVPGENINGLDIGNLIEVSGIVKSAGIITATRIDKKTSLNAFKLNGVVSNLNTDALTFTIGALTINYSGLNFAAGTLDNGTSVEIKGSIANSGAFVPTDIKSDKLEVNDAERIELEGYVSSSSVASGGNLFVLNDTQITTTAATKFSRGMSTDLITGVHLEVEGTLQSGVFTATEVKFQDSVKIESNVSTVSMNSLTLAGLSPTVTVNNFTEFDEVTNLAEIQPSNHIKVRGRYNTATNTITATHIDVEAKKKSSSNTKLMLQGPAIVDTVSNPSNPTISIIGVPIDTAGIAFEGDSNNDPGSFFAAVKSGDIVAAKGRINLNVVTWSAIELED